MNEGSGDPDNQGEDEPDGTELDWRDSESRRPALDSGRISPAEAFALLANETRIEILQALWRHDGGPVSFTELHAAIAVDKGNFNYHLSELEGHYVDSTDTGYELRETGKHVVRAVLAGTLTSDPTVEPTDLGVPCPLCGGDIEFSYDHDWITVRCTSCRGVLGGDVPDGTFMHHPFPPAGLHDRDGIEVLEAARVHYEVDIVSMLQGVCPECGGVVDSSVHVCEQYETDADGTCSECGSIPDMWSDHTCVNCGYARWCTLWLPLLFHPAIISFIYNRQPFESLLELRRLFWLSPDLLGSIEQTVVSEQPLNVKIRIPYGGDAVELTVDGNLTTVDGPTVR